MREFNITGVCVPNMHYMVDTKAKIDEISIMVDKGLYFTINRARQYGKTTTFNQLRRRLADKYLVVKISFEGLGDEEFKNNENFCRNFSRVFSKSLKLTKEYKDYLSYWERYTPTSFPKLDELITEFCKYVTKPVVLMIDEVDKTSNNQIFLDFLGMLRNKYLSRNEGDDYSFQSVILAGVYDVKNLKRKITGELILTESGERMYNSPWNIAADFLVDMSFNSNEIASMLIEYEKDFHTGMNVALISDELYRYTNGYPFLVSKLCKIIDERLDKNWSLDGVEQSVKILLEDKNTLFDDMFKNIENNKKLYDLIFAVMIEGREIVFSSENPAIELGSMFGILINKAGKVAVANVVFEMRISNYLVSKMQTEKTIINMVLKEDVVKNESFDMALCLEKFSDHFYELYNKNDESFLESHGRLLFITYLKPLINGQGFYHIEPQTRNIRRMDLVVDYGEQQFIIEMKLWNGSKRHEDAYNQLWDYLDSKDMNEGYLLTFDFRKDNKQRKAEWIEYKGKRIFDVVV